MAVKYPKLPEPIMRNNDEEIEFTVYEPDGVTEEDITGFTLTFRAKREIDGPVLITKSSTNSGDFLIDDAANGHGYIILDPADTTSFTEAGTFLCALEAVTPAGKTITRRFSVDFELDIK